MKTYIFGSDNSSYKIDAQNIELAIKLFKVQVLYPEAYVSNKYIKDREYDSDLERYVYEFKNNPQIPVYEYFNDSNKKNKFLKNISLYECINVEYNTGKLETNLIEYSGKELNENEDTFDISIIGDNSLIQKDITQYNKMEVRAIDSAIMKKMGALEAARQELEELRVALQNELSQKTKMLYIIETYLGIHEEIFRLKEGTPSSEKEPLSIYQLKLYMDEEVGLWENDGLDFRQIDVFDAWLLKDNKYKTFLYKEQSICAFQVRRNSKDYGDPYVSAACNQENYKTYFLIRNGENLYRIWSDVHIPDKMFPTLTEYDEILKKNNVIEWAEKEIQKKHEHYMYGMIAVQGMIERTNVFNNNLKNISLLKINGFTQDQVNLIRDGEPGMYIGDGQPSWRDFIKNNRSSITVGTRVVVSKSEYYEKDNSWRTSPYYYAIPKMDSLYIVDKSKETHPEEFGSYHGASFIIHFLPTNRWNESKRKIPFRLYRDELINYDAITLEECEYYEKNRYERQYYLNILPNIHYIKGLKLEERKLEDEFIRFIIGKTGNKFEKEDIRTVVRWWKLKNKWKRDILSDESLAVRMVLKRLYGAGE